MLCLKCLGDKCEFCEQKGFIIQNEDAYKILSQSGDHLFKAYAWLKNHNQLPAPGTWIEQSAKFIKAVDWCDHVHAKWARKIKEHNEMMEGLYGKKRS